ncbi:MAG TPA: primary-amine oxidase, partial [Acidimicrobiales bacterium]|nr:primary-amine oxidase [Acidimicrobiales bacterium]
MTTSPQLTAAAVQHPLDPLSADEMAAACAIATNARQLGDQVRFPIVVRQEPIKDVMLAWRPGDQWDRRVELLVLDRAEGILSEVVVSLSSGTVVSWQDVPGHKPPLLFGEALDAILAVKADPTWQEAVRRRGITDLDQVQIDPWPAGNFGLPGEEGRRLSRCVSYARSSPTDNGYAHPLEGLVAVVDLATMKVIELVDTGPVPIPEESGNYDADAVGAFRSDLKPIAINQAEGPSFVLDGHEISWQRWRLRFSVHPIEGLVLHTVSYDGRSILYRASIAEMVVPYGATGACHWWKNAFDAGEWGLGRMLQPLANGCDCLGEIRYADAVMSDETGGATVIANAVCVHEEDFGILWKHADLWNGVTETRRSRRLVVSAISTVGNYEYGFYWYFYLDGTLQLEVKLTGVMQTAAVAAGAPADHAALIAPQLAAPHHQHLFCARLDVDLDGMANSVYEVDAVGDGDVGSNPHGNGFAPRITLLARESEAQHMADPLAGRCWKVVNPSVTNRLGQPVGYRLITNSPARLLAGPAARITGRATFATRNLWVT